MKKIRVILVLLFVLCAFQVRLEAALEKSLTYHSYANESETGEVIAETLIKIKETSSGQTVLSRQKQADHCMINDEFILDEENSLESWTRICLEEDTEHTSKRKGNVLVIKGKLKGKNIDKELELGERSLHIYPKYSLTKFVLSDMQEMRFWSLRRDKMSKLLMRAVKKGIETIKVNGKEVEVIKVYYTITRKLREKSFHHNYYYRKSDGLFIKKEEKNGRIEELVKEK